MGKGGGGKGKAGKSYDGGKAPWQHDGGKSGKDRGKSGKDGGKFGKDGGKSGKGQDSAKRSEGQRMSKNHPQDMIRSLSHNDDERMAMSKKISWILRHGAKRLGITIGSEQEEGWVKMSDLVQAEILDNVPEGKILSVIHESNEQKLRYELKEVDGVQYIKALSKDKRRELNVDQPQRGSVKPNVEGQPVDASLPDDQAQGGMRATAPPFVLEQVNLQSMLPPPSSFPPAVTAGFPWQLAAASYGYPMMPPNFAYPWPLAAAAAMGGRPPAPPPQPPGGPAGAPGPAGNMSARYHGRIKSFNAEKGFGFIESTEAHQHYGRDVFLHKALIGDLKVNDEVIFGVQFNEKGMPQAKDLATPQGQIISVAPMDKNPGKGGKGKGGRGKGGKGDSNRAARGERGGKNNPGSPTVVAAADPPNDGA